MRDISRRGFIFRGRSLSPEACQEVAEIILARSAGLGRNLDLRLLVNTLRDRMQFEDGLAEVHWTDLLESRLQERAVTPKKPLTKVEQEKVLAQALHKLPRDQRMRRWEEQTGRSEATFYRRLSGDSQDSHLRN